MFSKIEKQKTTQVARSERVYCDCCNAIATVDLIWKQPHQHRLGINARIDLTSLHAQLSFALAADPCHALEVKGVH